jgi:hypothetical protein
MLQINVADVLQIDVVIGLLNSGASSCVQVGCLLKIPPQSFLLI